MARKAGPQSASAQASVEKLLESLAEHGRKLQEQARMAAHAALGTARMQAEASAARATAQWEKLEQIFAERLELALARLGVPTRTDIESLTRQVAELDEAIRAMRDAEAKAPAARQRRTRKAGK